MEKKKVQMSLTGLMILIVFIAAVVGGLVYFFTNYDLQIMNKNESSEIVENEKEEELSKVEELNKDNEKIAIKEIVEISDYIEKIYPKPGFDKGIPKFEKIIEADKEWIWSVILENAAGENDVANLDNINYFAEKLFGKEVGEFPKENEELLIEKYNDGYHWWGNQRSIPDVSKYFIKSISIKENMYEVEIIEYLEHDWFGGIWIEDLEGNKIETFVTEDEYENIQINYDEINKNIEQYVENNIEKFNSKVLIIEYNESENLYRIISVK